MGFGRHVASFMSTRACCCDSVAVIAFPCPQRSHRLVPPLFPKPLYLPAPFARIQAVRLFCWVLCVKGMSKVPKPHVVVGRKCRKLNKRQSLHLVVFPSWPWGDSAEVCHHTEGVPSLKESVQVTWVKRAKRCKLPVIGL